VEETEKQGQGGTRWRRFAAVMVPTVAVVGVLGAGIASGAVPVTFAVSGTQFHLTASHLSGKDFTQYGSVVKIKAAGAYTAVAESTISSADITKLCQSVGQPLPNLPGVSGKTGWLKLTAGDGNTPAHAVGLIIDMTHLQGDATFTNINIGQDASDLNPTRGQTGGFGQAADGVEIDNLDQTAWSTTAGTFTLPNLDLSVSMGASGDDPCNS
jgi:hypothetical protein